MLRGFLLRYVFFLLVVVGGRVAHAEELAPRDPRFAFLDATPSPVHDLPPEPTREGDEYPRRAWEGFPSVGASAPFCRGNDLGFGQCGDTMPGAAFGAGLLYRVSPYIALGLDASFARFTSRASNASGAHSRASWIGVVVRGYFLDRGPVDPYVETGFGQGSAVAGYIDGGVDFRTEVTAPSVMTGAGIDFWIAPYLRIGPALSYRIAWISSVQGCSGSTCSTFGLEDQGAVGSFASFSFRATVALGREM